MSESHLSQTGYDPSECYEICLKGHLDARWKDWFDGLTISLEDNGNTRLTGAVADQAALHGLLAKIRDLGLPLVSLMRVSSHKEMETTDREHSSNPDPRKSGPSRSQSI